MLDNRPRLKKTMSFFSTRYFTEVQAFSLNVNRIIFEEKQCFFEIKIGEVFNNSLLMNKSGYS